MICQNPWRISKPKFRASPAADWQEKGDSFYIDVTNCSFKNEFPASVTYLGREIIELFGGCSFL